MATCKRWQPEDDAMLRTLLAEKYTHAQAGKMLGRTQGAVVARAANLGIESNAKKGRNSFVLNGESTGGKIVTRLDKRLHGRLAELCKSRRESINDCIKRLIAAEVGNL